MPQSPGVLLYEAGVLRPHDVPPLGWERRGPQYEQRQHEETPHQPLRVESTWSMMRKLIGNPTPFEQRAVAEVVVKEGLRLPPASTPHARAKIVTCSSELQERATGRIMAPLAIVWSLRVVANRLSRDTRMRQLVAGEVTEQGDEVIRTVSAKRLKLAGGAAFSGGVAPTGSTHAPVNSRRLAKSQ
jgi:hypothetical protein